MGQGTVNGCLHPIPRLDVWILASQFVERQRLLFSRHVARKQILRTIKRATNVAILVMSSSRSLACLQEVPMDALLTRTTLLALVLMIKQATVATFNQLQARSLCRCSAIVSSPICDPECPLLSSGAGLEYHRLFFSTFVSLGV